MNIQYILQYVVRNAEKFQDLGTEAMDVYRILEDLYRDFQNPVMGNSVGMQRRAMASAAAQPAVRDLVEGIRNEEAASRSTMQKLFGPRRTRGTLEILQLVITLWPVIKQIIDTLRENKN